MDDEAKSILRVIADRLDTAAFLLFIIMCLLFVDCVRGCHH